ncbi:F-box/kelch-repeat protein At3g23880-like [Actinidia eriantha]|uniref:F-box/kelch-repeat protein At3g23880-like n=1 Tax=Actinidia eriantha TaxID=165200 RepID=UPI0025846B5C|nr:F-box/kelch-repeat protein At3g23880-like [Actinidia eriantha]
MATESGHSTTEQSHKRTRKKQIVITLDEESFELPLLPPELIVEILLFLPVKSLIRFKSVCKSWQTMISKPQFAKKHLSLATKDDIINPWRIIIRYPYHDLKSCSLHSIFHEPQSYVVDLDYPLKRLRRDVRIVGSCDGLVCISFFENLIDIIYIWNPSTRETHILPSYGRGFNFSISYGFGYDSSNDDYKVVRVAFVNGPLEVKVYSLRTDSWRRIQDFPSNLINFHSTECGQLVNGSLNWAATHPTNQSWVIIALDLGQETYREIPQPNYGKELFGISVRALRGSLCVVCNDAFTSADLWVMKEYGVTDSWTKLVSIPYIFMQEPVLCSGPLWYLKDGGILVDFDGLFVLYDLVEHTIQHPLIYGIHDFHQAELYLESLVSPHAFMKVPIDLNE